MTALGVVGQTDLGRPEGLWETLKPEAEVQAVTESDSYP